MCWYLYLATKEPLKDVLFAGTLSPETPPPPLYFEKVTEPEDVGMNYKPLFKGQNLYYLGSDTGCGCGFNYNPGEWPDEEKDAYSESPAALVAFIKSYTTEHGELEMYAIWEDDHGREPVKNVLIDVENMNDETYLMIKSRHFYQFSANI
ncbi:MAG: hypothetical protein R3C61_03470 [Bacteroidia bacterium]